MENPTKVRRRQSGSSDLRRLEGHAPESFTWRVDMLLRAGRSAGVLFGMSDDGARG